MGFLLRFLLLSLLAVGRQQANAYRIGATKYADNVPVAGYEPDSSSLNNGDKSLWRTGPLDSGSQETNYQFVPNLQHLFRFPQHPYDQPQQPQPRGHQQPQLQGAQLNSYLLPSFLPHPQPRVPQRPLPHPRGHLLHSYPPQRPSYPPQVPQRPSYPPQQPSYPPNQFQPQVLQLPSYPPKQPQVPQQPSYPPKQPSYPPNQLQPQVPQQPSYPPKQPQPQVPQQPSYPPKQPQPQVPQQPSYPPKQPQVPQQPSYPPLSYLHLLPQHPSHVPHEPSYLLQLLPQQPHPPSSLPHVPQPQEPSYQSFWPPQWPSHQPQGVHVPLPHRYKPQYLQISYSPLQLEVSKQPHYNGGPTATQGVAPERDTNGHYNMKMHQG
ncbi:vegetative cell wall protein gp1-like isoform X5 [Micropterus dolomieu]|uniref:vegetative cell wall protein gp1-like isoform X5 n=1 Tax=Micropterus dolomieu TaxID=147949 RepID=UPI001E8DCF80|nr:vegetative cell wall protein gp1-like isoform X5 [Micropterus dolomieu]